MGELHALQVTTYKGENDVSSQLYNLIQALDRFLDRLCLSLESAISVLLHFKINISIRLQLMIIFIIIFFYQLVLKV